VSDYYDLCLQFGRMIGASGMADTERTCSEAAQISLLLLLAENVGLTKAARVLRPLVDARTNEYGDLTPDAGGHP